MSRACPSLELFYSSAIWNVLKNEVFLVTQRAVLRFRGHYRPFLVKFNYGVVLQSSSYLSSILYPSFMINGLIYHSLSGCLFIFSFVVRSQCLILTSMLRFTNLSNLHLIDLTKRVVCPLGRRSTVIPKKLVQFG